MVKRKGNSTQIIKTLQAKNLELQSRLDELEEALRAIGTGEVDALVVYGEEGERIYTLQGADYAYRVMVESIHEGAANIKPDGTILYCNKRLAEMLELPLERVLGSSFFNYLSPAEHDVFSALARKGIESFGRAEFSLAHHRGSSIPVLITASAAEVDGRRGVCLVITDLTEQKQALARERELQIHLTEQREEERIRIARNLHDGPLQDIISLSYTLQSMISNAAGSPEENDLHAIRQSILKLAGELRGVCNDLRPPNTIRFGLAKAIQYQSEEIQIKNPDLKINLELSEDGQMIPKDIITTLFRIFQECMNNVVRHAKATTAEVRLILEKNAVRMEVQDDGIGFQPPADWLDLARHGHLGLVGMRERAEAVGGNICVESENGVGTTIRVEIPCQFRQTSSS